MTYKYRLLSFHWCVNVLYNTDSFHSLKSQKYELYSVLNAVTGSFFAAFLAGISPPINVSTILRIISTTALTGGSAAFTEVDFVTACIILLLGINNNNVIAIPIIPEQKPIIKVSALNTCEIFLLEAPIARRIPISLVQKYK